jgi:hypothetical protein
MLGVVMHRAGAAGLILTDGDSQTLANAAFNLRLNGVPLSDAADCGCAANGDSDSGAANGEKHNGRSEAGWVCCRQLCWEDGWDSRCTRCQPELIFGADLLYDPNHIPGVLSFLKQALHPAPGAAPGATAAEGTADAAGRCSASQPQQQPAAYLATMLRNESTLQRFLEAASSEPCLHIQELAGGTAELPSAICFQHLPELEATRSRIFLHRITGAHPC